MKGNSRKKTQVKVCDVCGDKGFSNALIDCSNCPDTFAHQYCMGIPPGSVDSSFTWVCEDCCEPAECRHRNSMMSGDVSTKSSEEACDVSIDVTITKPKMKAVTPLYSESKGNKQKRKRDSLNPDGEPLSSFRSQYRVKRLKDQSLPTNKDCMGEDITTNMSAKVEAKSKSRLRPKVIGHANNNLKLRNEEKGQHSNDEIPIDPGVDPHSKFDCQNIRLNVDEDNFEPEIPYHRRPLTRRQLGAISKAKNQGPLTVPDSSIEQAITIDDEGTIDCNVPITKRNGNAPGSLRRKATVVRRVIVEEQLPEVVDKERLCEALAQKSSREREKQRLDFWEDKSLGDQPSQDATEVEFVPTKFNYDPRKLKTRITSNPLCDVINLFTNEQRLAICDMGFGGFLKISCKKLPQLLPSWLVHHFDPKSCSLKFIDVVDGLLKELPITENDVHLCLGLPQGPNRIILPESEYDNDDGFYDFMVNWRQQYRNTLPVTTLMPKHFMEQTDGGVDFKRNFIVFIVSSFFLAGQSVRCKVKALKTCINVDEVCNFNWCEFVVHRLVDSVSLWRKNPRSKFTGPIFVLMMIFLDRVLLKRVDRLAKRVFPTVCGWTTKKVKDYVRLCIEHGGLGQGVIYDLYDKSIDWMPKSSFYRDLIQARGHHGGDELRNDIVLNGGETMKDVLDFCDFKAWVKEMKSCTENVVASMERFHFVLERGIDNFGSNGVVVKLRDSALNLFKSFLNSDVEEASTKAQVTKTKKDVRMSDDFTKDPDVVAATCYLVDATDRMIARRNKNPNIPNF